MNFPAALACSVGIGYILGCINPAYFFGKMHGFDIRTRGTNNAGASNTMQTLGWGYAAIVALYDVLKAVISYYVIMYLFPEYTILPAVAGCGAILGHNYPFYLQFKGGKGFASYLGLVFAMDWKFFLCIFAIGLILTLLTRWIVSATFAVTWSFPIYQLYQKASPVIIISLTIISMILFVKHIPNIKRFFNQEEFGWEKKPVGIKLHK